MSWLWKALLVELVSLVAPVVCLVYRGGWFATPDDTVSPYGGYEPSMRRIYARFGKFIGDWWWLGVRNRAFGLSYRLKPAHFKRTTPYVAYVRECKWGYSLGNRLRTIRLDGFKEYTVFLPGLHIIAGYRLRPIRDEILRTYALTGSQPVREVNMDARPILSIRFGSSDD